MTNAPFAYAAVAMDASESTFVTTSREQAEAACREHGWRLPERNEIVLVTDQDGVTVGSYSPMLDDWWTLHGDRMAPGADVTHWMPLPEPPEVK